MFTLKKTKFILRTSSILFPIFLGTFLIKPNVALAGNFSQTCRNIYFLPSVSGIITLRAECKFTDQAYLISFLTISNYITNDNGILKWSSEGQFQRSCTPPFLTGSLLNTICNRTDGSGIFTFLNLDEKISNINGRLQFDGF